MKYKLLLFALITGCAAQEIYMMSSEWSRWSPWSFCSGGVRVRVRACATVRGFKCIGHNKEFQSCDLSTTTSTPSEGGGKGIDDPFLEDRSMAMKQLYPDYDQPFKPQVKGPTTEVPFFKNNNLLERLRESDSLSALINRAASITTSPPSTSSPHPAPILTPASDEEYEEEEEEEEEDSALPPPTTTPLPTQPPATVPPSTTTITRLPEMRVATVTPDPGTFTARLLPRKRPVEAVTTTEKAVRKEGLESLEHYVDGEEEEEDGSEYEEPSEGDEGGEKRRENEKKSIERNKIVAAASKILTEKKILRAEEEEEEEKEEKEEEKEEKEEEKEEKEEEKEERKEETPKKEHVRHKVDGGDDDVILSSPLIQRQDIQAKSSQINHIPVVIAGIDPFEDNGVQNRLLGVEVEMKELNTKSPHEVERTLKKVNGIIEKLEYEARFRATKGESLTPLQKAYLKRSNQIRFQLEGMIAKSSPTTPRPITTTLLPSTSTEKSSTPPEPLNPKIAEDTVRALDWLMENINDRLVPDGITVPVPTTTTERPKKVLRNRTVRPSYMKGVRYIENGEEIHPHPIRLHSIATQRNFRLPSSSIRTFGTIDSDGKVDQEKDADPIPLLTPSFTVSSPPPSTLPPSTSRPRPSIVLPIQSGIEPIIGTDWEPFEWSEWSDWSECVCGWQLRKRICIPNAEEVQCPAPEYQRRKCEGGSCKRRVSRQ